MNGRRWPTFAYHAPPIRVMAALAAIVGVALLLRGWRLDERSVWFDEAFSWRLSVYPWDEMFRRILLDNHPPLHFIVLKLWTAVLGESPVSMRLLSVLLGTSACLGMYLLMVEAYGRAAERAGDGMRSLPRARWMGLLTAVFVALSVVQIRWSWEIRGYALGAGLAAWSGWLLLRAMRLDSLCAWTFYVVVAISFAYTHIYALFSLLAQAIYLAATFMGDRGRSAIAADGFFTSRRPWVAMACVFAAWAQWLPSLFEQRAHVLRDMHGWPLHYWSIPESCCQLWIEPQEPCRDLSCNLAATAICGVLLGSLLWRPTRGDVFVFLSAIVPPALGAAISLFDVPMYHSHYLLFAQLFLLAALARLVGRIAREPQRTAIAALVALNLLFVYFAWRQRLDIARRPGLKAAIAFIERSRSAGDPVVVTSPFYFPSAQLYLNDRRNCYLLDDGHTFRHYEGTAAFQPRDFIRPDAAKALIAAHVWVLNVKDAGWGRTSLSPPPSWREAEREEFAEVYSVQGKVEVIRYDVGGATASSGAPP